MTKINNFAIDTFSKLILRQTETRAQEIFKENSIDGLSVYQNNHLMSLISSLKNTYVITEKLLGSENFKALAGQFSLGHASSSPNLDDYGKDFAAFLSDIPELEEIGYIQYIASLDFFWFHAEENRENIIKLPKGILTLWAAISNERQLEELAIDEDQLESIRIDEDDGELFLVGKLDV